MEIIKRSDKAKGFDALPRRWAEPARGSRPRSGKGWLVEGGERTIAWLNRCRRLAKDFEAYIASAEAWVTVAHIRLLTHRLARFRYATWQFESDSDVAVQGRRYFAPSRPHSVCVQYHPSNEPEDFLVHSLPV